MKARTCRSEFSSATPPKLAPQTGARRNRIAGLLGMAISILVLCVVAVQCHRIDMTVLRQMLPTSVGFWLVFTANYFSGPIGDWIIFRRLWRIPWSGLGALIRKLVTNELVFGYLGETQFYAWARANMTVAPFGAIKDVAVLSALVGNVATLALLACCWPVVTAVALGFDTRSTALSLAAVLLSSFAMFVFRQMPASAPKSEVRAHLRLSPKQLFVHRRPNRLPTEMRSRLLHSYQDQSANYAPCNSGSLVVSLSFGMTLSAKRFI